jgi:ABC-type uncharacterized transport system fused permease/ATPase subunit
MGKKLVVKDLMDVLIYVVFASVLIPIIASNIHSLNGDENISETEYVILGLITTFIILGVVYAIVKTIL